MQTLVEYVVGRINDGRSRADICEELVAIGWTEGAAESAYREALIARGAPLPMGEQRASFSPKVSTGEIVANFFSFILLHIVIWGACFLYLELIDLAFKYEAPFSDLEAFQKIIGKVNGYIAALAIAFPLYVLLMRHWLKGFNRPEPRTESRLTAWLTYLVQLYASIVMLFVLIFGLYVVLQGDMSVDAALKMGTFFGISVLIFAFYTYERQLVRYRKGIGSNAARYYLGAAALLLVGAAAGFFAVGYPQAVQGLKHDPIRRDNLTKLAGCIEQQAKKTGRLPESLAEVEKLNPPGTCPMTDPRTEEKYAYRIISESRQAGDKRIGEFELCADFALRQGEPIAAGQRVDNWQRHNAGRNCVWHQALLPAD